MRKMYQNCHLPIENHPEKPERLARAIDWATEKNAYYRRGGYGSPNGGVIPYGTAVRYQLPDISPERTNENNTNISITDRKFNT